MSPWRGVSLALSLSATPIPKCLARCQVPRVPEQDQMNEWSLTAQAVFPALERLMQEDHRKSEARLDSIVNPRVTEQDPTKR